MNRIVYSTVITCYKNDYKELLLTLKNMDENERIKLYEHYSRILFPKKKDYVSLEDQLRSPRKDYERKFYDCFLLVTGHLFSPAHLGECCFSLFNKKRCYRYPQKVILALGLMGYIKGIRVGYSNSGDDTAHGYIYDMDLSKLNVRNMDTTVLVEDETEFAMNWEDCAGWEKRMQFDTICSMEVLPEWKNQSQTYLQAFDQFISTYTFKDDEMVKRDTLWSISSSLLALDKKEPRKIYETLKIDKNYAGRFYSPLTNMKGEIRRNALTLDGEHLVEVDVSSAQPTFLGLLLRREDPHLNSMWLEHCIRGDFYEWLMKITGIVHTGSSIRKKVKQWTLKYLYTTDPMEIEFNPRWKSVYKKEFAHRLSIYLYENERALYDFIARNRANPVIVPRKKSIRSGSKTKKRNNLCLKLTTIEVEYIKECIRHISREIKHFYSIHDCLGCKESDAARLQSIMEQVSWDMFGVVLGIKIERGTISNPETLIGSFNPQNVIKKTRGKKQQ